MLSEKDRRHLITMIKKLFKIVASFFILLVIAIPKITFAADDGPRMYWNAPVDLNILQIYTMFIQGNSISTNNNLYNPSFDVDMELLLVEYDHIFDLVGHSFLFTGVLTAGQVSAKELNRYSQSTSGMGDLYIQGVYNVIGAPALSLSEFENYEQDTVVSLLLGISLPTGSYDRHKLLNMGQNRWGLRAGVSFIQSLGDWIPGEITTLEILPSAWFYSHNDDFIGKSELIQDTLYTLETHLTRDITDRAFVSLDYSLQSGGETSINGSKQNDDQNIDTLGITLGYQVNEQSILTLRYSSSLNPNPDKELDVDVLQVNINFMW
jgi:hypothetical protein